jgi:hypothetical protein
MRVLWLLAVAACGTPGPSWVPDAGNGSGGPCEPYMSTGNMQTPVTSFATDVTPVLQTSCTSVSCHGIDMLPSGNLFLGNEGSGSAGASMVVQGLVGQASGELPTMPYVTAGDPTKSYLMHKMDNDLCVYQTECVEANCMAPMPDNMQQLSATTRDVLRRWITQGAKDN